MNGYLSSSTIVSSSASRQDASYLPKTFQFDASDTQAIYHLRNILQFAPTSWPRLFVDTNMELKRFNRLVKKWKRDTAHLSSMEQIVLHPDYQEIIGMGPTAVRLIFSELEREPYFWFWALRSLTGANPVSENMHGDLMAMTNAWLDWGRQHEYI